MIIENNLILAKRLSKKDKDEIIQSFTNGISIDQLSTNFNCTKSTITRNLKIILGEDKYLELINKFNSRKKKSKRKPSLKPLINQNDNNYSLDKLSNKNKSDENNSFLDSSFVELPPLNYEIDNTIRKDLSSIPISEISFPKLVYMVVDKNIELEVKYLRDYPEWQFLSEEELNRKTIEIFFDLKIAKRFCNKEQKVIKVPNTEVFKIAAPHLLKKGISRIVSPNILIAL